MLFWNIIISGNNKNEKEHLTITIYVHIYARMWTSYWKKKKKNQRKKEGIESDGK